MTGGKKGNRLEKWEPLEIYFTSRPVPGGHRAVWMDLSGLIH